MLAECNFIHENMKVTFASGLINMLAECNFIHENMKVTFASGLIQAEC